MDLGEPVGMKYLLAIIIMVQFHCTSAQHEVRKDVDYAPASVSESRRDLLDIYMPEGAMDAPVMVYFHGGALLRGDKASGEPFALRLVEVGIGVVCVNYRLSPQFAHPTHVNDAASATRWVRDHIADYGGDPERIYVAGHSAGAYLAALLAIDPGLGLKGDVLGAVLVSPFLFVEETAPDRIIQDSVYAFIWGSDPAEWLKASVTPHLTTHRDNILLIFADGDADWRKDQNRRFADGLRDAGGRQLYVHEVPDRDHGSLMSKILDEDDQVLRLTTDFIIGN